MKDGKIECQMTGEVKMYGIRCEICYYYKMIDSGYGYCMRFPPKSEIKYFRLSLKKFRVLPVYDVCFQIVPWTQKICGEYKRRSNK